MIPIRGIIAIQVRMTVKQAQAALASLQGNIRAMQSSLGAVNAASASVGRAQMKAAAASSTLGAKIKLAGANAMKSASQFQWFSRQLMYNWGIPLTLAGGMATSWALDVERSMTQVKKVYGDISMDPGRAEAELDVLGRVFEKLSNMYGVAQEDVVDIGAAWAAAGAQSMGLARATKLSLEAMILGDLEAADATNALIAIQESWRFSAQDLQDTLANLNLVENETAADMGGLIDAFLRAGSSARIAGLDAGDLAAMIAGITPAAGSASTAGNSLKTVFSRLAAPTAAAKKALKELGLEFQGAGWKALDTRGRLEKLAKEFSKYDADSKQRLATDIFGRHQYNKGIQLFDALADKTSAYWTAQKALAEGKEKVNGVTKAQIQYEKELQAVLMSNPKAMEIVTNQLKNELIAAIIPLIPYMVALIQYVAKLVQQFNELDPQVKSTIAGILVAIVALTAFSKIIAAIRLLWPVFLMFFGGLVRGAGLVATIFGGLGKIVAAPFRIASAAVGGLMGWFARFANVGMGLLRTLVGFRTLPQIFGALGAAVSGFFGRVVAAGAIMAKSSGWISGFLKGLTTVISGGFTKLWTGIGAFFTRLPGLIATGLARLGPAILAGLRTLGPIILRVFTGPWGLAISAVITILIAFRDQIFGAFKDIGTFIGNIWNNVTGNLGESASFFSKFTNFLIECFYALPKEIQTAMQAVVDIVYQAAMAVYNLFSYLNPFARHSPSLVENVTGGMEVISKAFATITKIGVPINKAYADLKKFKELMRSFMTDGAIDAEFADNLKAIGQVNPNALGTAKEMVSDIKKLTDLLYDLEPGINAQQRIVDEWEAKLDKANAKLDEQQNILEDLTYTYNSYRSIIDEAEESLSRYSSASIAGLRDAEEQIWQNEYAQNVLKLAMLELEDASSGFDTMADRLATLNGEFETLTAKRDELAKLGAGSDILQYYDEQIAGIQAQKNAVYDSADAYTRMSEELKVLEKQGNKLDLQKSVNFDAMIHEIERLADTTEELSYEEIINGITRARETIDEYTPALNAANEAMKQQQIVVDRLKRERDLIQRQYDIENAKLKELKAAYDEVKDAISELRSALNEMASAAKSANKELSRTGSGKGDGLGLSKGGAGGKSVGIKDLEKGTAADIEAWMNSLQLPDFTGPIREKWEAAVKWWQDNIQPAIDLIVREFSKWWNSIDWSSIWGENSWVDSLWKRIQGWLTEIGNWLNGAWDFASKLFGDDFGDAWDNFVSGIENFINNIGPGFKKFWEELGPYISHWIDVIGGVIGILAAIVGGVIAIIAKIVLWIWNSVIDPLLSWLGDVIGGIARFFGGLMEVISGIFERDGEKIKEGLWNMFMGLVDILWSSIRNSVIVVWNLIGGFFTELWQTFSNFFPNLASAIARWWGLVTEGTELGKWIENIAKAFQWLYDFLVGHSVVPDLVNGIVSWFNNLVGWALAPIETVVNGISGAFGWVHDKIMNSGLGDAAKGAVDGIGGAFSGVWDFITGPFKSAETDVKTSVGNLETTVKGGVAGMNGAFGSKWSGLADKINDPFAKGVEFSSESFDDIYNNFTGLGKDLNKSAKTDFKKVKQTLDTFWNELPEDQKGPAEKMVKQFLKTAEDIQKKNPALWNKIKESITTPTSSAATSVETSTKNMQDYINKMTGSPTQTWKNLGTTIPQPIGTASFDVDKYVKEMQNDINNMSASPTSSWNGLSSSIPKPVKDAKSDVSDKIKDIENEIKTMSASPPSSWGKIDESITKPFKDAAAAIKKINFNTSSMTKPLNKVGTAADNAYKKLKKLVDYINDNKKKLESAGIKVTGATGGAVTTLPASSGLNIYAGTSMATGGAVHGPGGPTSDKVRAWLSSGEHVFTAREVSKLGGQNAVYALRSFIRSNDISGFDLIKAYQKTFMPGYADGGAVVSLGVAAKSLSASARRFRPDNLIASGNGQQKVVKIEHAHFEFPNIKNPSDAKEFLDNLESLL